MPSEQVKAQGLVAVVDRHRITRRQALGQAVKRPCIRGGIAVHDRRLQGEAHRADLHFDLAGAGLRAHQVHDRAVHIHIPTKEMHGLGPLVDHAVALAVALVHGAEAHRRQLLLGGIEEAAAVDVQKRQPCQQFTLREGLEHGEVLEAGFVLGRLDQGEAHG
jgi:hypothetical protein